MLVLSRCFTRHVQRVRGQSALATFLPFCLLQDGGNAREQEGVEMQQDFDGDVGDMPADEDRDAAEDDAQVCAALPCNATLAARNRYRHNCVSWHTPAMTLGHAAQQSQRRCIL